MITLHLNFMFKVISHDDDDLSIESYKQWLQQHYDTLSNTKYHNIWFLPCGSTTLLQDQAATSDD